MRATGLDGAALALFPTGMAGATDAQTCEIAVAIYSAPARLPRDQAARLASVMFQPGVPPPR
jgi:hypothetical protein